MKARFEEAQRRMVLLGAIITSGIAMAARQRPRRRSRLGRRIEGWSSTERTARRQAHHQRLVPAFRSACSPLLGGWCDGRWRLAERPTTSCPQRYDREGAVVGHIVPSWNDGELRLTIEPAGGAAVQTTVFERVSGGGTAALDRETSTSIALEEPTRHSPRHRRRDAGWLGSTSTRSGTRFSRDLPAAFRRRWRLCRSSGRGGGGPHLRNVVDVPPLRR